MATVTLRREAGKIVEDLKWEAEELEFVEKDNGPAAAALIAAGLGAFWMGLLTTLSEASTGIADWLIFDKGVGPLSGKTIMAVVLYLASWAVLAVPLWKRNVSYGGVTILTSVLVALGVIGTFPKFFELFAE